MSPEPAFPNMGESETTEEDIKATEDKMLRVPRVLTSGRVCVCYANEEGGHDWYTGVLMNGHVDFEDGTDPVPFDPVKDEAIPGMFHRFIDRWPNSIVINMTRYRPRPAMPEHFSVVYGDGSNTLFEFCINFNNFMARFGCDARLDTAGIQRSRSLRDLASSCRNDRLQVDFGNFNCA